MRIQNELDHEVALRAKEAMKYIKPFERWLWADWKIGEGLILCRWEAMTVAGTGHPRGKGYNTIFAGLLTEYALAGLGQTNRIALLNIMEHRQAVEEWRQRQDNPASLNNPDHVWRSFQRSAHQRDFQDRLALSGVEAWLAHIKELEAANELQREEIERLEGELETERERSADFKMRLLQAEEFERWKMLFDQQPRRFTGNYRLGPDDANLERLLEAGIIFELSQMFS